MSIHSSSKFTLAAILSLMLALSASVQAAYSVKSLKGKFSVRLTPATSFAPFYDGSVAGEPDSGVNTAPRQDILRVGVLRFDGNGGVTGRFVATTDDGITTVVKDFTVTGTYTVDADGMGTLSIAPNPAVADEGPETYALVINTRVKSLNLTQTDNDGGGAKIFLTGEGVRDAAK
jgi:hypothetical protein